MYNNFIFKSLLLLLLLLLFIFNFTLQRCILCNPFMFFFIIHFIISAIHRKMDLRLSIWWNREDLFIIIIIIIIIITPCCYCCKINKKKLIKLIAIIEWRNMGGLNKKKTKTIRLQRCIEWLIQEWELSNELSIKK